ncbi:LOW QUALITY PROTEIN: hypothetical protein HID58_022459 [Brassica napus]|uniref:Uncharacterized protein n=1 Tax=Brassica napus TaxID=3708 RepID=A0ABQ8CZB9_BRANA|nr:LOW QUALITY PROTEIN: hypothetical protein HID58_022459 [Brassica napus]
MVILPAVESSWKDVSGGGCGFAMATSESGKLITCGSTDDLGQIYVTSGKHCETPEPFPLPPEVCVQKAEAGWDHCVARAMKFIHGDGRNVYPLEECLDKWKEIPRQLRLYGNYVCSFLEMAMGSLIFYTYISDTSVLISAFIF